MKKAVVIGSGIAGIASSIRLACAGYTVDVFEANEHLGGKMERFQLGDFQFDLGPSLFTLPNLVEELFELAGRNPSEYFEYLENPISCKYYFSDDTKLTFHKDRNQLKKEIESNLGVSAKPFFNYLDKAKKMYEVCSPIFLERSLHKLSAYLNKDTLRAFGHLPQLDLTKTMNQVAEKNLNHPKLVQISNRYGTYNGSNPFQAPGVLTMIPHLEQNIGTFFPKQGMRAIPDSLIKLAKELGVEFHTSSKVRRIHHEKGKVTGIETDKKSVSADVVISNSDVFYSYKELLPNIKEPKSIHQERSSSAIIFYWGIDAEFPELDLHNIFFSEDYQSEFEGIFKKGEIIDDPTIYVHISSKIVKSDAPDGKENWFVMVNTPCDNGQDWDYLIPSIKNRVLEKLEFHLKKSIRDKIIEERVITPLEIQNKTRSYKGALYGTSSNNPMAAFLRHKNFSSEIDGLYFCGGSAHPGGGIPLCLLSAKIATSLVLG